MKEFIKTATLTGAVLVLSAQATLARPAPIDNTPPEDPKGSTSQVDVRPLRHGGYGDYFKGDDGNDYFMNGKIVNPRNGRTIGDWSNDPGAGIDWGKH